MSGEHTPGQHLITAAIVDAFIKARDDFSDNNTSSRQDIRHGLETIAPMILARAAAPDLLAALKRQRDNIDRWRATGEPAGPDESKSIYDQICAAIVKAEGGSP